MKMIREWMWPLYEDIEDANKTMALLFAIVMGMIIIVFLLIFGPDALA